jgi:hypothetical protein
MKDFLIVVVVWLVLGLVFFRHLGELIDKDNGDYKKHNKHYKMEVVK